MPLRERGQLAVGVKDTLIWREAAGLKGCMDGTTHGNTVGLV